VCERIASLRKKQQTEREKSEKNQAFQQSHTKTKQKFADDIEELKVSKLQTVLTNMSMCFQKLNSIS